MTSISGRARARLAPAEIPEDDRPLHELYRIAADEWAECDASYYALDNLRTALIADLVLAEVAKGAATNRAEHIARASAAHKEHVNKTADLKRRANEARGRMESIKMQFAYWNSADANQRAERKLVRQAT
jgi:hypothetical protein